MAGTYDLRIDNFGIADPELLRLLDEKRAECIHYLIENQISPSDD